MSRRSSAAKRRAQFNDVEATEFPVAHPNRNPAKGRSKTRRSNGELAYFKQQLEQNGVDAPSLNPRRRAMSAGTFYRPVKALTEAHSIMMDLITKNQVIFAVGAAGTGKTKVAVGFTCQQLRDGEVDKVYLIRPAVAVDEDLGALPGEIQDKYEPYFRPFREHFNSSFNPSLVEELRKDGVLEALPVGFCRGLTFGGPEERAVVLIDEAQNCSKEQMKMLLTRIGDNAKVIITGDSSQVDITRDSGLAHAKNLLKGMPDVGVIEFRAEDSVRGEFCREVLRRYDEEGA